MRTNHTRLPSGRWRQAAAALGVAAILAGCSAGGHASSGSGAAAAPAAAPRAALENKANAAGSSAFGGDKSAAAGSDQAVVAALGPRLVRTADLTLEVNDLAAAATAVRTAAVTFGGRVGSETTGLAQPVKLEGDPAGGADVPATSTADQGESVLVLRIPEPRLDAAIADLVARLHATVLSRTSTSSDVTGDLADLASRVATQRASVARVRALLVRASSLQDVVLLESEMSKRESDLEALEARQATLSDQADLATLTVTLRTPEAVARPEPAGFLAGLRQGWDALRSSTVLVLTVLGAVLPIAITLAVIAVPLALLARRRLRNRPASPAPPPAAP